MFNVSDNDGVASQ